VTGATYWATGITVHADPAGGEGWGAAASFYDDRFGSDDEGAISTQGTLSTRYTVRGGDSADGLTAAIDAIRAAAEHLGIAWDEDATVAYIGGGIRRRYPPPSGWREALNAQAARLGWRPPYPACRHRND
jgi:hypothetical protein